MRKQKNKTKNNLGVCYHLTYLNINVNMMGCLPFILFSFKLIPNITKTCPDRSADRLEDVQAAGEVYNTRTSVRSRAPCSRPAGWLWDLRSNFTPKALDLIHTQLSHFPKISVSKKSISPNPISSEYYHPIFQKSPFPEIPYF